MTIKVIGEAVPCREPLQSQIHGPQVRQLRCPPPSRRQSGAPGRSGATGRQLQNEDRSLWQNKPVDKEWSGQGQWCETAPERRKQVQKSFCKPGNKVFSQGTEKPQTNQSFSSSHTLKGVHSIVQCHKSLLCTGQKLFPIMGKHNAFSHLLKKGNSKLSFHL